MHGVDSWPCMELTQAHAWSRLGVMHGADSGSCMELTHGHKTLLKPVMHLAESPDATHHHRPKQRVCKPCTHQQNPSSCCLSCKCWGPDHALPLTPCKPGCLECSWLLQRQCCCSPGCCQCQWSPVVALLSILWPVACISCMRCCHCSLGSPPCTGCD